MNNRCCAFTRSGRLGGEADAILNALRNTARARPSNKMTGEPGKGAQTSLTSMNASRSLRRFFCGAFVTTDRSLRKRGNFPTGAWRTHAAPVLCCWEEGGIVWERSGNWQRDFTGGENATLISPMVKQAVPDWNIPPCRSALAAATVGRMGCTRTRLPVKHGRTRLQLKGAPALSPDRDIDLFPWPARARADGCGANP